MLYVFLITILFDGVHLVLTGIIKTLTTSEVLKLSLLFFYVVGIGSSSVLCFFFGFGLWGLWVGWLIGVGASLVTSFVKIVGLDW